MQDAFMNKELLTAEQLFYHPGQSESGGSSFFIKRSLGATAPTLVNKSCLVILLVPQKKCWCGQKRTNNQIMLEGAEEPSQPHCK